MSSFNSTYNVGPEGGYIGEIHVRDRKGGDKVVMAGVHVKKYFKMTENSIEIDGETVLRIDPPSTIFVTHIGRGNIKNTF